MAHLTTSPAPGDMTVPLLHGGEGIVVGLLVVVAVAVLFLLAASARPGAGSRAEWQAWLDARSGERRGPPPPGDHAASGGTTAGD
jgi:hypothetical protein